MKHSTNGCEFGDRARWCDNLRTGGCYTSENTCCETCSKRRNNMDPTCPYGDSVSWCPSIQKKDCYSSDTAKRCCDTCSKHRTNIEGCEYGDRNNYCKNDYCETSRKSECCLTCYQRDVTTESPTTNAIIFTTTPTSLPTIVTTMPIVGDKLTTLKNSFETTSYPTTVSSTEIATETIPTEAYPGCDRDKASWCSRIKPSQCYKSDDVCCQTCRSFILNKKSECRYGDRASWCATWIENEKQCKRKDIAKVCCDACLKIVGHQVPKSTTMKPIQPKCVDKAGWCPSMSKSNCYVSNIEKTCCETCSKHHDINMPDCRYGDKFTWCPAMKEQGRCRSLEKDCCVSCA